MPSTESHSQRNQTHEKSPSSFERGLGFDGFTNLVSDIEASLAKIGSLRAEGPPPRPEPAVVQMPRKAGTRVNWKLVIPTCFVATLVLGMWAYNNSDSRYDSTNNYSPSPPLSSAGDESVSSGGDTLAPQSKSIGTDHLEINTADETEEKPNPGSDKILSRAQLQYCLAEAVRIDGTQAAIAPSVANQVAVYNSYVDDFNARCGSYRYYENDMVAAKAYVEAHRANLDAQGMQRLPRGQVDGN